MSRHSSRFVSSTLLITSANDDVQYTGPWRAGGTDDEYYDLYSHGGTFAVTNSNDAKVSISFSGTGVTGTFIPFDNIPAPGSCAVQCTVPSVQITVRWRIVLLGVSGTDGRFRRQVHCDPRRHHAPAGRLLRSASVGRAVVYGQQLARRVSYARHPKRLGQP